ncbi:Arylsulfatase B, partial [Gryllus bimaculatus]
QPHIVVFVADDLGFNDVSFHGSNQIPTPNIDALAYSGIILNRHYVQPVCTPTRAALMTAKYPIRMGLQGTPLIPGELRAMPPGKILPEYMRELGYATHAVGKWHLGFYEADMTPTYRGFDSHVGYWNGLISYYDHVMGISGRYATDVFTERAEQVVADHDPRRPLFLYVAHLAVHAGNNGQLVEAPRPIADRFRFIDDPNRRMYA